MTACTPEIQPAINIDDGVIRGEDGTPADCYPIPGSTECALTVHQGDVHNVPINELFHEHSHVVRDVAQNTTVQQTWIVINDSTGLNIGDYVQIENGGIESTFPQITNIVVNNLTLDRPLDRSYSIGDTVEVVEFNMATAVGTLTAPVKFVVIPDTDNIYHIQRILIVMSHASAADNSKFGGITALPNGVLVRANINGTYGTFTNWKSNKDIISDMYDVTYTDKAGGGLHGTQARGSFNRIGVSVRLDGSRGDFLEITVQDDLTALTDFQIKAQGHLERE